jgi:hypothetical protein
MLETEGANAGFAPRSNLLSAVKYQYHTAAKYIIEDHFNTNRYGYITMPTPKMSIIPRIASVSMERVAPYYGTSVV